MPIYEYACTACGERTEKKQAFNDLPLEVCPTCGGKLRKLYSPVGIVFKGSGFYSTDAKPKSSADQGDSKPKEKTSKDSPSAGSKASESKSKQDSKPATSSAKSDS